jgi:hypothetical protein
MMEERKVTDGAPEWHAGIGVPPRMFGEARMEIARFCAVECELQQSGERSVFHMLEAYEYAQEHRNGLPDQEDIRVLGYLVEPKYNSTEHYRTCGVRVGSDVKAPYEEIPTLMTQLLSDIKEATCADQRAVTLGLAAVNYGGPSAWFKRYEDIHPWEDGNGRSGTILFNWWRRTLHAPEWPPNFWRDPRRKKDWGA